MFDTDEEFLHILNTGSARHLQELHTVGAKRARLIFDWRQTHGNFTSVSTLHSGWWGIWWAAYVLHCHRLFFFLSVFCFFSLSTLEQVWRTAMFKFQQTLLNFVLCYNPSLWLVPISMSSVVVSLLVEVCTVPIHMKNHASLCSSYRQR